MDTCGSQIKPHESGNLPHERVEIIVDNNPPQAWKQVMNINH